MAAPPMPGAGELRALAEKYRVLCALRTRRDDGAPGPAAAVLRVLAAQHPGCLRELDTLGGPELQRRALATAAAAEGGPHEPWMSWIWAYHRLMQATLAVKRAVDREGDPGRPHLAAQATRLAGWALDEQFVAEVARPPQRRLGVLVLHRLGVLYGAPPAEIARTLFPPRRPSPYTLG